MKRTTLALTGAALVAALPAAAQDAAGPLAPFAWMDGRWRGEARVMTRNGPVTITQTERSGELLGGRVRLVEGKGYNPDGSIGFNALGVIAPMTEGGFEMRSWTLEAAGAFPIEVAGQGFRWETPGGPNAVIRYSATFDGTTWTEVGQRVAEGQPPMEIFRMVLTRVDDTDWPAAGALGKQ